MRKKASNFTVIVLLASVAGCNSGVFQDGVSDDPALADSGREDSTQDSTDQREPVTLEGHLYILVWDDFQNGRSGTIYDLSMRTPPKTCYELLFSSMPRTDLAGEHVRISGMLNSSDNTITLSPEDVTLLVD